MFEQVKLIEYGFITHNARNVIEIILLRSIRKYTIN